MPLIIDPCTACLNLSWLRISSHALFRAGVTFQPALDRAPGGERERQILHDCMRVFIDACVATTLVSQRRLGIELSQRRLRIDNRSRSKSTSVFCVRSYSRRRWDMVLMVFVRAHTWLICCFCFEPGIFSAVAVSWDISSREWVVCGSRSGWDISNWVPILSKYLSRDGGEIPSGLRYLIIYGRSLRRAVSLCLRRPYCIFCRRPNSFLYFFSRRCQIRDFICFSRSARTHKLKTFRSRHQIRSGCGVQLGI